MQVIVGQLETVHRLMFGRKARGVLNHEFELLNDDLNHEQMERYEKFIGEKRRREYQRDCSRSKSLKKLGWMEGDVIWWNPKDNSTKYEITEGPWEVLEIIGEGVARTQNIENGKESRAALEDCKLCLNVDEE